MGLKLKVMIKQMNECDLIICKEERKAMFEIDSKIKELQLCIKDIEENQTNHIVEESKKCQNEINKTFEELYDSLKKRQKFLLNKLQQISNDKKNELIEKNQSIVIYPNPFKSSKNAINC